MGLITVRRRPASAESAAVEPGHLVGPAAIVTVGLVSAAAARLVWHSLGGPLDPLQALQVLLGRDLFDPLALATFLGPFALYVLLGVARRFPRAHWVVLWLTLSPWALLALSWLLPLPALVGGWLIPVPWAWLGLWPLAGISPIALHRARWATPGDLRQLRARPARDGTPPTDGLVLGRHNRDWLMVRPLPEQRELGGMLVVGRPRSGKGLLAVTQLLGAWEHHSAVCTDLKGELHAATAGWRVQHGKIVVLDPTGVGHRFDPLAERETEDDLYRAAQDILHVDGEGDGQAFTERAASMLAALFVAAKREDIPCLPYARELIRQGLRAAGARLDQIDPLLCQQLIADRLYEADWESRFLTGSWQTLVSRTWPLLTERVVRTFGGSDFRPADLLGEEPISVYLRLTERDMRGLKPLLKLVWETLLGELVAHYDRAGGVGCNPVLLLLDEAARFAVPSLPEYAATVPGRGLSLWVAVQSLSQLDGVYGRAGALALREALESHVYYRPSDLATAQFLEDRLGEVSAYARSVSKGQDGGRSSEGRSERPVPLLVAQEILQLPADQVVLFHRDRPPAREQRADWRLVPALAARNALPTPPLAQLLPVAPLPSREATTAPSAAPSISQPPQPAGVTRVHRSGSTVPSSDQLRLALEELP
jgi:type IV secretion system protein VirD4